MVAGGSPPAGTALLAVSPECALSTGCRMRGQEGQVLRCWAAANHHPAPSGGLPRQRPSCRGRWAAQTAAPTPMCRLTALLRLPHRGVGQRPPLLGPVGPPDLLAPAPNPSYSRLWHSSPVQPAGQRQRPVCRSQRPPLRHLQLCWQPAPKRPGRHSAEVGTGWRARSPRQDHVPRLRRHPRPLHASHTDSFRSHVLGKDRWGAGHTAGPKPHPGTMFPPKQRGRPGPRPIGVPALPLSKPLRLPLSSACPVLTLLTGQAGPALWAGAVA